MFSAGTLRWKRCNDGRCRTWLILTFLMMGPGATGIFGAAEPRAEFQLRGPEPASIVGQNPPILFSERLAAAMDRRSDHVFADRLHSFNVVKWKLDLGNSDSETFPERTTGAAKDALTKSVSYSVRDAVAESPFMLWLEDRQETLAAFLRDSIDGVEEEAVSPLDGSYGLVERSWWKSLRRNGALRYGIRPFRTSPYAFTSFAVRDQRELLFLGHVRYYYQRLENHRFELAVSLPLPYRYTLDMGTAYEFGRDQTPARMALKLFRELKTGGIAHFGLEIRERPTLLAGITFLW